ncbi:Inner membrane protein YiaV precursor [Pirellula sp. SH-Sr6A]|uniref:efflux RND transporter periplasmic adaptor subunit n=1 Tax=Pirellula sp. SH-Sr6A TaxID=1632865 RepID=UPI00078EF0A1|nr:HlyD family efflux transporter periplasmic adaptor subunit [Pirellula sp. SH-Sr6A]AMV31169.1 Inner membrane protein YiaV precursor [Pirellula sp. SH-Sr6A]
MPLPIWLASNSTGKYTVRNCEPAFSCLLPTYLIAKLKSVTPVANPLQTFLYALVLPAAIVAIGIGALVSMGTQEPREARRDGMDPASKLGRLQIVSVAPIEAYSGNKSLDISLNGTVVPFRRITLAAEVGSKIKTKSANCRLGRFVKKGEVLFQLDATDFELEVQRLQALRDSEYSQQRELDQEVSNAKRSLELADEEVALQEKEIKRLESLPAGLVSESELDQARRTRLSSANQRLTIQNQMQVLETRRTRIQLAEKLAAAQLAQAVVNLERTSIRSPIDGVIVSESVEEDSYVAKGATLCQIEDTQRVEVSCNLRTDQLLLVLDQNQGTGKAGSSVIQASSYELPRTPVSVSYRVPGREDIEYAWEGHLSRYEGIGLDSKSRTVPVRVTVENPREVYRNKEKIDEDSNGGLPALVNGMFVDLAIHTKPSREFVLLPKLALLPGNQVLTFQPAPELIRDESERSPREEKQNTAPKAFDKDVALPGRLPAKSEGVEINVSEWEPGKIQVVNGVKVIRTIRPLGPEGEEYWVAESIPALAPGVLTVVSPMATLVGDGSDTARFQKTNRSSTNAASENLQNGGAQ